MPRARRALLGVRRLALGRHLHDGANAAVPPDSRSSGPIPEGVLSSREIAVFRAPPPRAGPLREALRASRLDGDFTQSREEDLGATSSSAIQATVDALLRLPATAGPAADAGVDVCNVADLVDYGKPGPREAGESEKSGRETDSHGDVRDATETTTRYDMSRAGEGRLLRKAYATPGVKTLEWTTRHEGGRRARQAPRA